MHRWSTRTYLGVCGIPQDHHLMQVEVPRQSLQYDSLLNGMLALSSLDIGMTIAHAGGARAQSAVYNRAAMEYYDKSIKMFREEITSITAENHLCMYLLGVLLGLINIAELQFPSRDGRLPSVLERMPMIWDLLTGPALVALRCGRWLYDSTESVRVVLAMGSASSDVLDADTRGALALLAAVNDRLHISAVCRAGGAAAEEEVQAHEMYKNAIPPLERCFAEEARGWIDGFLVAFPALVRRGFMKAVKKSDPMALLVLVYYGVLIDGHGKKVWWAAGVGKRLIVEISDLLELLRFPLVPGFREAMSWARRQVGLPVLIEGSQLLAREVIEISGDLG